MRRKHGCTVLRGPYHDSALSLATALILTRIETFRGFAKLDYSKHLAAASEANLPSTTQHGTRTNLSRLYPLFVVREFY